MKRLWSPNWGSFTRRYINKTFPTSVNKLRCSNSRDTKLRIWWVSAMTWSLTNHLLKSLKDAKLLADKTRSPQHPTACPSGRKLTAKYSAHHQVLLKKVNQFRLVTKYRWQTLKWRKIRAGSYTCVETRLMISKSIQASTLLNLWV